ncbi:MAG: SusD/RagB family nutrient-binding outer membrane lipoprotein [Chitinophagaceae bacterium]|nr:SusD/RagB family nutrient-binding outer membrane lipoprotein [Chitinophagaceae bacterium]
MKLYKKILKMSVVAGCLLTGTGCTKNFTEINTDHTLVTSDIIKPSLLFTGVLKNSIFSTYNTSIVAEYSGYYANQGSGVIFQNANWAEPFNTFYTSYIINMAECVRLTAKDPKLINENAMARIFKVWLFQMLTDMYGDVPYFQAAQSMDETVNQPKYDKQQDIYKDMLKELKEAVASLSDVPTLSSYGDADLLYGGSVDKWRRFGNSLRLRLAIRVRYADATLAKQHITDLAGAVFIDDNSLNAKLTTIDGTNPSNRNPLMDDPTNSYPLWVSFTLTDNLKKLNDPRLPVFAKPATDGVSGYRGRPIAITGTESVYTESSTAYLSYFFRNPAYSIIIFNTAEVYFLKAEAGLAGLSSDDAQAMYTKGIQASMGYYSVDQTASNNYTGSAAGILSGTDEEKTRQIIVQKWIANFYEVYEGWAEFRRTGYPEIWTGNSLGSTNGEVPRRLTYPLDEYTKNGNNVKTAASLLSGGDAYLSRVWWDAKPGLPFHHPKQGMFPPE